MNIIKKYSPGLLICLVIAICAWYLGKLVPVVGGPVFSIIIGMIIALAVKKNGMFYSGINFTSKKILQYAVVLLGFGMNLSVVWEIGVMSLPIILSTITISLVIAYILYRIMHVDGKIATLVGVGSAICGGSAIAATAPVIDADDEEVAQAISVIFFFNVIAAVVFPSMGTILGFDANSGESFGMFAGTAINDTSSVTAAASTWDSINHLGSQTLDMAVTVKLTRTLAIIPITLALAFYNAKKVKADHFKKSKVSIWKMFPFFILFFILASLITTICTYFGVSQELFDPLKTLSKFLIVMAMGAIGLNTNIVKLVKTGGKPLIIGLCCWISIIGVSLGAQYLMGLW